MPTIAPGASARELLEVAFRSGGHVVFYPELAERALHRLRGEPVPAALAEVMQLWPVYADPDAQVIESPDSNPHSLIVSAYERGGWSRAQAEMLTYVTLLREEGRVLPDLGEPITFDDVAMAYASEVGIDMCAFFEVRVRYCNQLGQLVVMIVLVNAPCWTTKWIDLVCATPINCPSETRAWGKFHSDQQCHGIPGVVGNCFWVEAGGAKQVVRPCMAANQLPCDFLPSTCEAWNVTCLPTPPTSCPDGTGP